MSVTISVQGNEDESLEMNVSQVNFQRICELIDADLDWCGSIDMAEILSLRHKVTFALDAIAVMPMLDGGLVDQRTQLQGGALHVLCGLREGYFTEKLSLILRICDEALETQRRVQWG